MQLKNPLLTLKKAGLYCSVGDFYIDPWKPVKRAVITHGHSDHASLGHSHYLCHEDSVPILKHRLGDIQVEGIAYNSNLNINGVSLQLAPAGHIPGSAQVLVEHKGQRYVASGDYKTGADGFCTPFQPIKCDVFITESTFGLPIYRWPDPETVFEQIGQWWAENASKGVCSVLVAYALGKAQRLLHGLMPYQENKPIYAHGAVLNMSAVISEMGYKLPTLLAVPEDSKKAMFRSALVLAAPSSVNSSWMNRFDPYSLAYASGWMQIRGPRRMRAADRGFVLSDHADWDGLNSAVKATGAHTVLATHGYSEAFSRWCISQGLQAGVLETEFVGEQAEMTADTISKDNLDSEQLNDKSEKQP